MLAHTAGLPLANYLLPPGWNGPGMVFGRPMFGRIDDDDISGRATRCCVNLLLAQAKLSDYWFVIDLLRYLQS